MATESGSNRESGELGSFIDEAQVRGRDKTRAQALCFSSGLVGANFSWSFFHTLLSIS